MKHRVLTDLEFEDMCRDILYVNEALTSERNPRVCELHGPFMERCENIYKLLGVWLEKTSEV